jgi:hypothetical protein
MNFLSLANALRQECGISASDLTTVTGQTGEAKRCVDWINRAWMDLQAMRQDWLWMRSTASFPAVAGQAFYTPAQAGVTDFGLWTRTTFRNYVNPPVEISIASPGVVTLTANRLNAGDTITFFTTGALPTGLTAGTAYYVVNAATDTFQVSATAGGVAINTSGTQSGTHTVTSNNVLSFVGTKSEIFMSYLDYENWRNAYQYGALRSIETRPMVFAIAPDKSLALGPIGLDGYTVLGDYYRTPSEMTTSTESPSLPTKFHMAIVYKAMISYGMFESASEVVQRGTTENEKWMRRILFDQVNEIAQQGALA